jgi:hypothetical protein
MAFEDGGACVGHEHGHDGRKQCFGGKTGQAPEGRGGYAAMRGEISGALVRGSSSRAIKR